MSTTIWNLQRERFGENLVYSVEYEDEELLHYLVPRLTIQPLVENAIVHGLEPRRGLGCVSLRLWEEDQSICVRVEDNGVGFDPASLDLSGEAADTGSHNHIALPNVLRRLHLLYGDRADLKITSAPGKGTQVMLILPIDETRGVSPISYAVMLSGQRARHPAGPDPPDRLECP